MPGILLIPAQAAKTAVTLASVTAKVAEAAVAGVTSGTSTVALTRNFAVITTNINLVLAGITPAFISKGMRSPPEAKLRPENCAEVIARIGSITTLIATAVTSGGVLTGTPPPTPAFTAFPENTKTLVTKAIKNLENFIDEKFIQSQT